MFKIEPIQDKLRQKELCELFGIKYEEDFFGYYMYDLDTLSAMGMSQFEIKGEEGYINDLVSVKDHFDHEAMFILGRQTMNFIDKCGAHKCYARPNGGEDKLLSSIGFKPDDSGNLFCNTTGMFDGKCGNH